MNIYDYWFDGDGKIHEITKMDTEYIYNCLNQLDKMLNSWRGVIPEQLTESEMGAKDRVGTKAWFVFNGVKYMEAFNNELEKRNK